MTSEGRPARRTGAKATLGAAGAITTQGFLSILLLPLVVVSFALIVIWVGLPLLTLTLSLVRGLSMWERDLAGRMLGSPVERPYKSVGSDGILESLRIRLTDTATYRDLLQLLIRPPSDSPSGSSRSSSSSCCRWACSPPR